MAKGGGASRPRFRLLPTVLLTVAILVLPTAVYAWGRSSSSFAINTVVLTGTRLVPERRALRVLRKDYLGRNLFTVTRHDVRESLEDLLYISDARIDRDFPDTLRVSVTEHEPAVYAWDGKRWYVVAVDGHVICEQSQASAGKQGGTADAASPSPSATAPESTATTPTAGSVSGLPAPSGKAAQLLERLQAGPPDATPTLPRLAVKGPIKPGKTLSDRALREALPVVAGLPRALRTRLAVVEVSAEGQITLHFAAGPVVVWGRGELALAKTLALGAVLDRYATAAQECTFVDVSTPDRVLARPVLK